MIKKVTTYILAIMIILITFAGLINGARVMMNIGKVDKLDIVIEKLDILLAEFGEPENNKKNTYSKLEMLESKLNSLNFYDDLAELFSIEEVEE